MLPLPLPIAKNHASRTALPECSSRQRLVRIGDDVDLPGAGFHLCWKGSEYEAADRSG